MTKRNKIIYWIATQWLALGMISTGIVQLIKMKEEVNKMKHLGYPIYFLSLLGVWKILGVVAVLIPIISNLERMGLCRIFLCNDGSNVFAHCNRKPYN